MDRVVIFLTGAYYLYQMDKEWKLRQESQEKVIEMFKTNLKKKYR